MTASIFQTARLAAAAALASIGLASAPLAAQGAGAEQVDATEAMACSALFTVLASAVEGEPEYAEFVDTASRWLVIASLRAGREEVFSEEDLQAWVAELMTMLEAEPDDAAREAILFGELDTCEANYQLIATEFDGLVM